MTRITPFAIAFSLIAAGACGDDGPSQRGDAGGANGDGSASTRDGATGGQDGANCPNPIKYYPDEDGDGFGSEIGEPLEACSKPAGYSTSKVDCADGDANAFPGQTQFFTEPAKGKTVLPFDYNCDGQEEPKAKRDAYRCAGRGYNVCNNTFPPSWWGTNVPACGETQKIVVSCTVVGGALDFICDPGFSGEDTQTCR